MFSGSNDIPVEDRLAVVADFMGRRIQTASQEYREQLQAKVANMREAVLRGETTDARVLEVAEVLERIAGNDS